jgi:hypothetical protein
MFFCIGFKKTELNHARLGLRRGYILISLKGDYSNLVAEKISREELLVYHWSQEALTLCPLVFSEKLLREYKKEMGIQKQQDQYPTHESKQRTLSEFMS